MRPSHITCACGATRQVPQRGAIPQRCLACHEAALRERNRVRALAYSRRPDIIARERTRRRDYRETHGVWT